jgi:hypothetical protein
MLITLEGGCNSRGRCSVFGIDVVVSDRWQLHMWIKKGTCSLASFSGPSCSSAVPCLAFLPHWYRVRCFWFNVVHPLLFFALCRDPVVRSLFALTVYYGFLSGVRSLFAPVRGDCLTSPLIRGECLIWLSASCSLFEMLSLQRRSTLRKVDGKTAKTKYDRTRLCYNYARWSTNSG